ncbi:MAG: hypothetical protein K5663_07185 [Clostridiales bacterium]|nr:hypothetical protein [Clostridiales bacterium]
MEVSVMPISMVDHSGRQLIRVSGCFSRASHLLFRALRAEDGSVICEAPIALSAGESVAFARLPAPAEDMNVIWEFVGEHGEKLLSRPADWKKPREWTFYIMVSSHTDIGLHNSPYVQRYSTGNTIEAAMRLCDRTQDRAPQDRYRYVLEGSWVFDSFAWEKGNAEARKLVRDYISQGKMGVCAGLAGNHVQTFGLEEMARASYERLRLNDEWGVDCRTLAMIDVNGMPWSMVQPFADAGYENVIFSPNHWNPTRSTVWHMDDSMPGAELNPEAGGGGSRMEMRFGSALPRVFYWQSAYGSKPLLVWSGGMYSQSGTLFGFDYKSYPDVYATRRMEAAFSKMLPVMEKEVPYDLWLMPCYDDDGVPDLKLTDCLKLWNENWSWPRLRTLGDPDEPFRLLRQRFSDVIPSLQGDLTGGWYQHPLSAPDCLARKFEADRLLPTAEKLSTLAALTSPGYLYPVRRFDRAWKALLCNDEHSYGTSGYQGRRVYETWIQHRDWIETALETARTESEKALTALSEQICVPEPSVIAFNPTALDVRTSLYVDGKTCPAMDIPSLGYRRVPLSIFAADTPSVSAVSQPPTVENAYYRLLFNKNGGLLSIYDKQLCRELLQKNAAFPANCFVWTQDNHQCFCQPEQARFEICSAKAYTEVISYMDEPSSGAALIQRIRLLNGEKLIRIDNELKHVRGLYNTRRYLRYAYYAFPFDVPGARRICALNGCEAEYGRDLTGHGTDVYMAAHEWVCAENGEYGVGVIQWDSELVEFDHIHPDKTDFGLPGSGSQMFFYLANDWLQMHLAGGSHIDLRFRYAITSYEGDHRQAKLEQIAEKLLNPPLTVVTQPHEGKFDSDSLSFMRADARLLTLKPAYDSRGIIARVYGSTDKQLELYDQVFPHARTDLETVDESPCDKHGVRGFGSVRILSDKIRISFDASPDLSGLGAAEMPVGSEYTGLILKPRAARGEEDGMLYLLWGAVNRADLKCYQLFRSEETGFTPNDTNLVATVEPEEYCVGRFVDRGLRHHTQYFYRVRTVDTIGRTGPFSPEFSAWTKE